MRDINVLLLHIVKQYKSKPNVLLSMISSLLWPIFEFISIYYALHTFTVSEQMYSRFVFITGYSPISFMVTGALIFQIFFSMVSSAWSISHEKTEGTFPLIFLTPIRRIVLVIGDSVCGYLEGALFSTILVLAVIVSGVMGAINVPILLVGFFLTVVSSLAWGCFMITIFYIIRSPVYYFYILQKPVELLSGCRIPVKLLPVFLKVLGSLLPSTLCLKILRNSFVGDSTIGSIWRDLIAVIVLDLIYVLASIIFLKKGVDKMKKHGTMNIF